MRELIERMEERCLSESEWPPSGILTPDKIQDNRGAYITSAKPGYYMRVGPVRGRVTMYGPLSESEARVAPFIYGGSDWTSDIHSPYEVYFKFASYHGARVEKMTESEIEYFMDQFGYEVEEGAKSLIFKKFSDIPIHSTWKKRGLSRKGTIDLIRKYSKSFSSRDWSSTDY